MPIAVTDLFPFANQCPRQAIRPYTDQSGAECNIIAEGFRFMPLGLVRLRTFSTQHMGELGATLMQVVTRERAQSGHVIQRCHNSPRRNGVTGCG